MNRIVYIPIEKKNREFLSKLLITTELARRGIHVVIGFYHPIFANAAQFPAGLMYFKGLNKVQYDFMRFMAGTGHRPVATDEEAIGSSDPAYIMQDCWRGISEFTARVFCQGEVHRGALMDLRGFTPEQLVITGNSRIDLLRPPFRDAIQLKADEIRRARGPFVLINTDCSSINGEITDLDLYRKTLVQIGWVDPKSAEDLALMEDHIAHDRNNMAAIEAFVLAMDRDYPDRRVVLRPHPTENDRFWHDLAARVSNLAIVTQTEAPQWILAADCLVQTGCTTGVEAAVLGTPTIGLVCQPDEVFHPSLLLTHQINPVVRSADDAVRAIRRLDSGDGPEFAARIKEKRHLLAPHIDIDEGLFAYEKIAAAMDDMLPVTLPVGAGEPKPISDPVDAALRTRVTRGAFEAAYFTQGELREQLRFVSAIRGPEIALDTHDLGWGVYSVTPSMR